MFREKQWVSKNLLGNEKVDGEVNEDGNVAGDEHDGGDCLRLELDILQLRFRGDDDEDEFEQSSGQRVQREGDYPISAQICRAAGHKPNENEGHAVEPKMRILAVDLVQLFTLFSLAQQFKLLPRVYDFNFFAI